MSWPFFSRDEERNCKNCGKVIRAGAFCADKCRKQYIGGSIIRDIIVYFFFRR